MNATRITRMLILSESQVRQCLSMPDALLATRQAFVALAQGKAHVPTRLGLPYNKKKAATDDSNTDNKSEAQDWTLFKPAMTLDEDNPQMGCKIVSIRAENPSRNLPLVPATVFSVDAPSGQVQAVVAGTYLTAARTAAGSALATAW